MDGTQLKKRTMKVDRVDPAAKSKKNAGDKRKYMVWICVCFLADHSEADQTLATGSRTPKSYHAASD